MHERPGHLVIGPVGGVELPFVVLEGGCALPGHGMAQRGGGQPARLVAIGDALAVERVDHPAGVAGDEDVAPGAWATERPMGSLPPVGGPQLVSGLRPHDAGA